MTLGDPREPGVHHLIAIYSDQHNPVVRSIMRTKSRRVNGLRTKGTPSGTSACPEVTMTCKVGRCRFACSINSKPFISGI
jgi:hypothetical protein